MTDKNLLRILFIEDLPSDVDLAVLELRKDKLKFEHTTVCTRGDLKKALKEFRPDLIISDYMMPAYNGLQALRDVKKIDESMPFILFTGTVNEETAVDCLKAGATDYVLKEHLIRLPSAVKEALEQQRIQIEKRAADLLLKKNEEKLQSIFRTASVGIGLVIDRVFIEVNDTFCKMIGFKRKELIGKSSEMIYPTNEEYDRVGIEKIRQIAEKGTGSVETCFKCKDGSILNIISTSTPLDIDDMPKGVILTVTDITENKRAEKVLKESEEKFRSIMENSADAIFITDLQGKYIYVNKAVTEMLGFSSEEMQSKTIIDITRQDKADETFKIFKQVLSEGKVFAEIELLKNDGNFISTDLNSVLLPGGLVYASCRNITERKQIQKELIEYRDHLEELVYQRTKELNYAKKEADDANKAKSDFLANMSHEIRTPMNAVLGYSELLSSTVVDQTQKDYINSIISSGKSLLTLINDILDLSKIEAGKLELEYAFVDIYSFFSEFERIFSLKVAEKGLKFILNVTSGTPQGVYIDESRVRQIVFNLIGNAVKFTSEGNIALKVFTENPQIVKLSKDKSEEVIDLVIEVKDTGIGISKELQEAIFEPFVQEKNINNYGGTGLGLTITRRLSALMDGSIHVKSKPGMGSTFIVRIPAVPYLRDFSKTTLDIQIDPSEIVFEKGTILVADDVQHNRNYLKDALKNTRLKIVEAEDGITAFKLALEIVPALIIADIRMPKMDGFQLLSKIKSEEKLKHIPVIAYSASVLKAQKERIHNSEFAGFLIKPVKVTELYIELMNLLPYKSTRKDKPVTPLAEVDKMGEISNLPELINSLKTDFYNTWERFSVRQPIGEIRDFGKNLIQLGLDHNSSIITGYGKDLISAADSFNIEAILKLLGKYNVIIESFKDSLKI